MNFYIFSSQTNWVKFLLPLVVFITGCAMETVQQPPIDPIPEGCPNNLEPKQEDRFCYENDVCHFTRDGQISGDRNETAYLCYQGQLRYVQPLIDPGAITVPVWE